MKHKVNVKDTNDDILLQSMVVDGEWTMLLGIAQSKNNVSSTLLTKAALVGLIGLLAEYVKEDGIEAQDAPEA